MQIPLSAIGHPIPSLLVRLQRVLRVIRSIIGAPDYERYVAHMELHHPGCAVMSHDEFMRHGKQACGFHRASERRCINRRDLFIAQAHREALRLPAPFIG